MDLHPIGVLRLPLRILIWSHAQLALFSERQPSDVVNLNRKMIHLKIAYFSVLPHGG